MRLKYAVVTSVDRDDQADGGAGIFARDDPRDQARRARHARVEVLIPDFKGERGAAADGARRPARRAQPQHRDGAAALSHGAVGRQLHAHARTARTRARLRAGDSDQDRPDGRPRRGASTSWSQVFRDLRDGRRLDPDDRPVPAPVAVTMPDDPLLPSRRIPRAQAGRARAGLRPRRVRTAGAQLVSRARTGRLLCSALSSDDERRRSGGC